MILLLTGQPVPAGSLGISPWSFWSEYLFHEVLLGTNIVAEDGSLPTTFYAFAGILLTFLITRGITRFIRRRSAGGGEANGPIKDIVIGGVHIHHQVFGIVLMLLAGLVMVATEPSGTGLAVVATVFGVGAGLAFDEFALWLHLQDVYWRPEGRKSVDAVAIVLLLTGVVAVVSATIGESADVSGLVDLFGPMIRWWYAVAVLLTFLPAIICLLKGKMITGGMGVAYIPLGLVGAFRLAKPDSFWARRFYRPESGRIIRSRARFGERYEARWNRVRDIIGGSPTAR